MSRKTSYGIGVDGNLEMLIVEEGEGGDGRVEVSDSSCDGLEADVTKWRTLFLVMLVLFLVTLVMFGIALRKWFVERALTQRKQDKTWYTVMDDQDGDFSDSISDTSSLFSPPFRPNDGVDYRSAAANVSETQAYLTHSVSTERFDTHQYDGYDDYLDGTTSAARSPNGHSDLPKDPHH